MPSARFDDLGRILASGVTRRDALRLAVCVLGGQALAACTSGPTETAAPRPRLDRVGGAVRGAVGSAAVACGPRGACDAPIRGGAVRCGDGTSCAAGQDCCINAAGGKCCCAPGLVCCPANGAVGGRACCPPRQCCLQGNTQCCCPAGSTCVNGNKCCPAEQLC